MSLRNTINTLNKLLHAEIVYSMKNKLVLHPDNMPKRCHEDIIKRSSS